MRRSGALLLGALLAALVLVPAATADKPERFFLPADDFVGSCPSFDVSVEILANKGFGTAFSDGRFLVTGSLKVRFTNLSDPSKVLDANVSGPGVFTPTDDGGFVLSAWGQWFFFFFAGDLGPGSPPALYLTTGLATLAADGSGNLTFTPAQNTTDLCVTLA